MFKEGRQITTGNIAIFINTCGQYLAAVLSVPGGIIGAPAKEGDTERCATDYHYFPLVFKMTSKDI
jgi:hypothetical protein